MTKLWTKDLLEVKRKPRGFKPGTKVAEQFKAPHQEGGKWVREFIAPEDFGTAWTTRQQYEISAGLDMEPLLYEPLFDEYVDESFPSNVTWNTMGPNGVVFTRLLPGGETQFSSIGAGSKSIPIYDFTVGIEYSERMFVYNEFFGVQAFEREAGIASNALMNHIHLSPFLTYTYTGPNQTAASAIGSTLAEKTLRTLEDAITNARTDTTLAVREAGPNYRRGPYALLVGSGNFFTVERALNGASTVSADLQSSSRAMISDLIVYDGWSGTMNGETYTYSGVSANKAYLIDISAAARMKYAISLIKFTLKQLNGSDDVSRLIRQQEILWDAAGVYVNVPALAEEISLPTS